MRLWLRTTLFMLLTFGFTLYAGFDGKKVQSITIRSKEANQKVDEQALVKRLLTREGYIFSQETFDKDIKTLSKDYDQVQPRLTESGGLIQVTISLVPRAVVDTIVFSGNHKIGSGTLIKELGLEEGVLLNKPKLTEGLGKIRQYYLRKGYFRSRVGYRTEVLKSGKIKLIIEITEGPSGKIQKINYDNIRKNELTNVEKGLVLQRYNFFTSWYTQRGHFIEEGLDHDRNSLVHSLQDSGLADANISGSVKEVPKGVEVTFVATRGATYRLRKVEIEGLKGEYEQKARSFITAKEGDLYSPGRLRKIIETLNDFYGSRGYCDAKIYFQSTLVDTQKHLYDVRFVIVPGLQYKVGMVRFSGNFITKNRVLTHESLMVPGELLSSRKLESTEKRLMNTSYFKSVHVRTVDSQPEGFAEGSYKDVIIEVEEADSTTKLSLKFGAVVQEGLYGGFSTSFDNFYLKGMKNIFKNGLSSIKGNGEHLGLEAQFSHHVSDYMLSWTDPYFLESDWSFGVDLENKTQRSPNKDGIGTHTKSVSFHGYYHVNNFVTLKLAQSLRREKTTLHGTYEHDPQTKDSATNGLLSTQTVALSYDSTNRFLLPTRGFRSTLGNSITEGFCRFNRLTYSNSYYWSPPKLEAGTFRVRLDMDLITPMFGTHSDRFPIGQRLRLGGFDTVRGYNYGELGRRDNKNNALGGFSRILFGVEYLYRINDTVSLFAFNDNGTLNTKTRAYRSTVYSSLGCGIRFDIMGRFPVIFGYAYPQMKKHERGLTRHFFFSIGGTF